MVDIMNSTVDLQKAASVQAMLAVIFGEIGGHYCPKERSKIIMSQQQELYNLE